MESLYKEWHNGTLSGFYEYQNAHLKLKTGAGRKETSENASLRISEKPLALCNEHQCT